LKQQSLERLDPAVDLEYFEVIDHEQLTPLEMVDRGRGAVICMAAIVGGVRLIDNIILEP
jgi:pantoate--beta-alanine ligase